MSSFDRVDDQREQVEIILGLIHENEKKILSIYKECIEKYKDQIRILKNFASASNQLKSIIAEKSTLLHDISSKGMYFGETKQGLREGKGICTYMNGERYEGLWSNNHFDGFGKYYYKDSVCFIGEFKESKKHGFGTLIKPDGWKYKGIWINDHLSGKFIATKNLNVYECDSENSFYFTKSGLSHL